MILGERCRGRCSVKETERITEDSVRYWSDKSNWPFNRLPRDDENVVIPEQWNMIMDVEETAEINLLLIKGILTIQSNQTLNQTHLKANHIYI